MQNLETKNEPQLSFWCEAGGSSVVGKKHSAEGSGCEDSFFVGGEGAKSYGNLADGTSSYTITNWNEIGVKGLVVLADGVGGYSGGEKASTWAVKYSTWKINNSGKWNEFSEEERIRKIQEVLLETNQMVLAQAQGSASTIAMALVIGEKAYVANIGDSRIYVKVGGMETRQVSHDHSWVQEQIDSGHMTQEEAYVSTQKNLITRNLGVGASLRVDDVVKVVEIGNNNICIGACCDGVWEVTKGAEKSILDKSTKSKAVDIAKELVGTAYSSPENEGDDITAAVLRLGWVKEKKHGQFGQKVNEEVKAVGAKLGETIYSLTISGENTAKDYLKRFENWREKRKQMKSEQRQREVNNGQWLKGAVGVINKGYENGKIGLKKAVGGLEKAADKADKIGEEKIAPVLRKGVDWVDKKRAKVKPSKTELSSEEKLNAIKGKMEGRLGREIKGRMFRESDPTTTLGKVVREAIPGAIALGIGSRAISEVTKTVIPGGVLAVGAAAVGQSIFRGAVDIRKEGMSGVMAKENSLTRADSRNVGTMILGAMRLVGSGVENMVGQAAAKGIAELQNRQDRGILTDVDRQFAQSNKIERWLKVLSERGRNEIEITQKAVEMLVELGRDRDLGYATVAKKYSQDGQKVRMGKDEAVRFDQMQNDLLDFSITQVEKLANGTEEDKKVAEELVIRLERAERTKTEMAMVAVGFLGARSVVAGAKAMVTFEIAGKIAELLKGNGEAVPIKSPATTPSTPTAVPTTTHAPTAVATETPIPTVTASPVPTTEVIPTPKVEVPIEIKPEPVSPIETPVIPVKPIEIVPEVELPKVEPEVLTQMKVSINETIGQTVRNLIGPEPKLWGTEGVDKIWGKLVLSNETNVDYWKEAYKIAKAAGGEPVKAFTALGFNTETGLLDHNLVMTTLEKAKSGDENSIYLIQRLFNFAPKAGGTLNIPENLGK